MKKLYLFAIPGLAIGVLSAACTGRVEIGSGAPAADDAGISPSPTDAGTTPTPNPTDAGLTPTPTDAGTTPIPTPTPTDAGLARTKVSILVRNDESPLAATKYVAFTSAGHGAVFDTSPDCTPTAIGACSVFTKHCGPLPGTETVIAPPTGLVITGGSFPSPMLLSPIQPSGAAATFGSNTPWWSTGNESIRITSNATSDLPPFTVVVPTPSKVAVALPTSASASSDLTFGWTVNGPASGEVLLHLNRKGTNGSNVGPFVHCQAQASAGSFVVPAAAIALLGSGTHRVSTSSESHGTTSVGNTTVDATILNAMVGGDLVVP